MSKIHTGMISFITGFKSLTAEGLKEELEKPVCADLKAIVDRGSDGCFTEKEHETFNLLEAFIRNPNNSLFDRARACYHYDDMMGMALPPDEDPNGIQRRWQVHGPAEVVDDFIQSLTENEGEGQPEPHASEGN